MNIHAHRLWLDCNDEWVERLTGFLSLEAGSGWQEEVLPENSTRFVLYFDKEAHLAEFADKARAFCPGLRMESEFVELPDPHSAWKEFFTPIVCGASFVVLPPWLADGDFTRRHKIIIEPGSAFGTGHHASTRLCLETLDRLAAADELPKGGSFLDLGCGTGILGLAAAMLGLKGMGADIDHIAIDNAKANAERNKIADLPFLIGGVETCPPASCDLILANILAGPLCEIARDVTARLKPGGVLILSGILKNQAQRVGESYKAAGLEWIASSGEGEWCALTLRARAIESAQITAFQA